MERFGRYTAERRLGSGAFGTVWLARDEAIDASVAIKVLAENWSEEASVRRRFIEEARILFAAESDHLVRVYAVDELPDGRPYFVMEYADRGSLEERMQERFVAGGRFGVDEALAISRDIAAGLAVAHSLGIAHRDLKPANVMFRTVPAHLASPSGERLVLVDFGVAKSLAAGSSTTIATGTPHYMAPEQAEGRADHRSDLYSAAVILYELLVGRVPYPVDSIGALIRAQTAAEFPPISAVREDVPLPLAEAIRRNLSPDPGTRSQDVAAWLAALEDPAGRSSVVGAAPGGGGDVPVPLDPTATLGPDDLERLRSAEQVSATGGATPPTPPPPSRPVGGPPAGEPPGRPRRRGVLVGSFATVAALAALVGGVLVMGGGEADGPAAEVFLEPISSVGRDPFGDVAAEPADVSTPGDTGRRLRDVLAGIDLPEIDLPDIDLPDGGGGDDDRPAVPAVSGAAPGLYGGTNLLSVCDTQQLVSFLESNRDKARAWADVRGIDVDEIGDYVGALTDVILQVDTRVINHGFRNGVANAIDSVLQKGTAVLVDAFGVPVVRCKCGNPLQPARPLSVDVKVSGQAWPGFDLDASVTVQRGDRVDEFVLADVTTGDTVFRLPGAPASATTTEPLVLEPPGSTTTTTTTPPTTTSTTTVPDRPITAQGAVGASSTYSSEFLPGLAVDGKLETSWFSAGGGTATYTWTSPADAEISSVEIIGNAANATPVFGTGFGFGAVDIVVLDGGGREVFRATRALAGTPDPDVNAQPNVRGRVVRLEFRGGEAPDCGGFAELRVVGRP